MKIRIIFIMAALLSIQVLSYGQEEQTKKIAILETVDREGSVSYGIKLMLRSSLSYAITNTPGYEGYDRVDLESIVGEQSFQRTGMVSDEQIKKLGEMTGAAYILVAEAAKVDATHIFITAKILNVETARLEATANVQTLTEAKEIEEGCKELAAMLLGSAAADRSSASTGQKEEQSWSGPTLNELLAQQIELRRQRQEARQQRAAERAEAKSQADSIRRQEKDAFNAYVSSIDDEREIPEGIYPGMKYRQYRKFYKASDYVRMPGDRYSPAAGGICSFFIPGLGQMVNGDVGRGFVFFGTAAGGMILSSVGISILDNAMSNSEAIPGVVLTMAGLVTVLGTEIWSIVDGVRHAKIKNMYMRDIRRYSSIDIRLNPYVASTVDISGQGLTPAVGLSLNITF